ncbi:MAG: Holliday junction branch migration protein RuvA [Lachnospiraceae bacterium]|nr:Holliday junction branch migration protein RuvA [Lachnospiraceae bacterium]
MIAYINGSLEGVMKEQIVVEAYGVGYLIKVPQTVIQNLPNLHEKVKIYTHQYVREDEISLFGFTTWEELNVFELLITISGIGPKAALSILSYLTVDEFKIAIMSQDAKALTKAQGIGLKGAQRILIELKDKITLSYEEEETGLDVKASSTHSDGVNDAIMAMVSLGYSNTEAFRAVNAVKDKENLSVDALIKEALKKAL